MWKLIQSLNRLLMMVPIGPAFAHLPDKIVRMLSEYLLGNRNRYIDLLIPLHLHNEVRNAASRERQSDPAALRLKEWVDQNPIAARDNDVELNESSLNYLADTAKEFIEIVGPAWHTRPTSAAFGTLGIESNEVRPEPATWRHQADQMIAVIFVLYVAQFVRRLRYLAWMSIITSSSLFLAITLYQFEPENLVMTSCVLLVVATIFGIVQVLVAINKNELISRVVGTTPNRFDWNWGFVNQICVFVLPVLVLVLAQTSGRLRMIFEPVLAILR